MKKVQGIEYGFSGITITAGKTAGQALRAYDKAKGWEKQTLEGFYTWLNDNVRIEAKKSEAGQAFINHFLPDWPENLDTKKPYSFLAERTKKESPVYTESQAVYSLLQAWERKKPIVEPIVLPANEASDTITPETTETTEPDSIDCILADLLNIGKRMKSIGIDNTTLEIVGSLIDCINKGRLPI